MSHHQITRKTQSITESRGKVSKIIKFLAANRGPHSIHNIRRRTNIDLQKSENLNVKLSLQQNKKVYVSGSTLEYQPTIPGIDSKDKLKEYIQRKPAGVILEDLEDAYCRAKLDLAAWNQSGRTIHFMNNDTKKHIVLWYYGRLRKHPIETEKEKEMKQKKEEEEDQKNKINMETPEEIFDGNVDKEMFPLIGDSIIATWNDIAKELPATTQELQRQLEEVGLLSSVFSKKPMRRKAVNLGGNKRKKRRLNMSRLNLTNIHMLQNEDVKMKMVEQNNSMRKDKSDRELPSLS